MITKPIQLADFVRPVPRVQEAPAQWGDPADIFAAPHYLPSPKLDREALPKAIGDFAWDTARRLGVEPAAIAVPALVACASATNDAVRFQPKFRDTGWTERACLWAALIAEPGAKKTPALSAATAPIKDVDEKLQRENQNAMSGYQAALHDWKENKKIGTMPSKPRLRRALVGDTTMEQLAYILHDNPRGILWTQDELAGLVESFDAYHSKGGKDRAAALELYNGGYRTVDRRSEGSSIAVENWSACILGGIQPQRIEGLVRKGLGSDGFLQRFLLCEFFATGQGEDAPPDHHAERGYYNLIGRLTKSQDAALVKSTEHGFEIFRKIYEIQNTLTAVPNSAAFKGYLGKLDGFLARLAITLHAINWAAAGGAGAIPASMPDETMDAAFRLLHDYFLPCAEQFYSRTFDAGDRVLERARWIAGYVLAHKSREVTRRELGRANHASNAEIDEAMQVLGDRDWVRPQSSQRQDSVKWEVNPNVHDKFRDQAAYEKQRREASIASIKKAGALRFR